MIIANNSKVLSWHIFDDSIDCSPRTAVEIVAKLWPWNFQDSTMMFRAKAFDTVLDRFFGKELGQFFTPAPVVNLMVGLVQPTVNDFVGDPAVGTGRTLAYVLEYVRHKEYQKSVESIPSKGDKASVDPLEPTSAYVSFRDRHLFGAEVNQHIAQIAFVNLLMNGIFQVNLHFMNSIKSLNSITNGVKQGLPEYAGFYPGGLTIILADPPLGIRVTDSSLLKDYADRDGVTIRDGRNLASISSELMFLNRCLEYLAPGGRLAILLPDGVLSNRSMQYVRDWILRWAYLKAIVSLPQSTYAPYGAAVKTSVVVLQKREEPLEQGAVGVEDYDIYMAQIDDIGYNSAGVPTVSEDDRVLPPEIKQVIDEFSHYAGW